MTKKKKPSPHAKLLLWGPILITIGLFIGWVWIYRNIPLPGWKLYGAYFGFFFMSLVQASTFAYMIVPAVKKDISKAGYYVTDCFMLTCFLYTVFLFPIHATFKRTLFVLPLIIAYSCIPQKANHDKREFTGDHAFSYNFALLTLMQMYYIWKNYDGHRIINIILCIVYAFISAERTGNIEQIDEYDKFEDTYNASGYAKATKNSFQKAIYDKGTQGEAVVAAGLESMSSYSKLLYNVYTPEYTDKNGKNYWVGEIDAIVISKSGINVIEIKNQSKIWNIFGEGPSDCICYDRNNKLLPDSNNPFSQNRIHEKNLKHLISRNAFLTCFENAVGGYVVFGPETVDYHIDNSKVKQGYASYKGIRKLLDDECKTKNRLSNGEIDAIYRYLKSYENNKILEAKHRKSIGY